MTVVRTCLGEERAVAVTYPGGGYRCPWCEYPVVQPQDRCENPACDASPWWTPETLRARREKEAAEAAERERRESVLRCALASAQEVREELEAWRRGVYEEARRRGACVECLFRSGWKQVKFVRHRGPCPRGRKTS